MTDETLPRRIREVLLESQLSGAAPPSLRTRIVAVPEGGSAIRGSRPGAWLFSLMRVVAAAGIVLAAGYLLTTGFKLPADSAAGQTAVPVLPAFDPTVDGPGIVTEANHHLRYAPLILAVIVSVVAIYIGYQRGRNALLAANGLIVAVILGALFVGNQPGVEFGNSSGPGDGIDWEVDSSPTDERRAFMVDVGPNESFGVFFNVTNRGHLPVRLEGVVGGREYFRGPRWTAVGMSPDEYGIVGPEGMQPFRAIDIAPGQYVLLYVAGRAGPCVLRPGDEDVGNYSNMSLRIAYSVLGMSWVNDIEPGFQVLEPARDHCA